MDKINLGFFKVDNISQNEVIQVIQKNLLNANLPKILVTPNAGHLKNVLKDPLLNGIYSKADLCLIDGWPIAVAASIVNKQKVPRITGSDLIPELLKKLNKDIRLGIIGGKDQIKIRQTLESIYPNLNIQLIDTTNWSDSIYDIRRLRELVQHNALSIVLLCLGHPKQEILAQELKNYDWVGARPDWIMCIGASIDYLIGDQNRSPKLFSKLGLEWFYRLILNPKKFLKRYASAIYPSLKLITKSIQLRIFN